MSPPTDLQPDLSPEDYPFAVRLRRSLARRLPRVHRAYNRLRAYSAHLRQRLAPRLRHLPASWRAAGGGVAVILRRRSERRLTVAVDIAAFWEPLTGIGWYLYRLLEHLADRDDLRLRLYGPTCVASPDLEPPVVAPPSGQAIELVSRALPSELVLPAGLLIRLLRWLEPLLIAADGNDVLFAPNYFLPRRFSLATGARVTTVHDLGIRRVPWTLRRETLAELRQRLEHEIFESTRIITVSAAMRDELTTLGYAASDRIDVVLHGPGQLAAIAPGEPPAGVPERFGLHVGTLEPRKNITLLLEAWRQARRRLPACPPLVLCGRFGWKAAAIRAAVGSAAAEGWVLHLGYVADAQLAALYHRAQVVVFPTLYEGFGLPAVEALWAGAPLVCSDLPVLREATGGAALFAPVDRAELFADGIVRTLTDDRLRAELVEAGRRRVAELSWHASATRTVEVFRRARGGDGGLR